MLVSAILLAGVTMNLILAFIIFAAIAAFADPIAHLLQRPAARPG